MPFNLKNMGAAYQWLVNKIFKNQICCNMEVYVDNILDKSYAPKSYVDDLEETFTTLCKYQMKLNPAKYTFRVTFGKFFMFMVSDRGIEANLENIQPVR